MFCLLTPLTFTSVIVGLSKESDSKEQKHKQGSKLTKSSSVHMP